MEFFKYRLPNGIRCIHRRTHSNVAYCSMTVNAGSRDEQHGEEGIAHFTEHAIFKGTHHRKAYQINCRLENLGGELNAFTTKEETVVHATTLRGDCPKAVELIADILFHSTFPQKELDKEKEVVTDEINSYKDSPADRIYDEFEDRLFSGSALGHNILGSKNTVNKFTGHDLQCFVKRCYNTDQMVFSSAGNISDSRIQKIVERYFLDIPLSSRTFGRQQPEKKVAFQQTIHRNTHQAHCIVGNYAYSLYHANRTVLSLIVNMLGGPSANSMLNVLLREKNGLTYNIEAAYTPYCDTGVASIYFGTDKENTDRCLELVFRQVEQLKNTALSGRQLSMAKKQFIGQLAISMGGSEGYMLNAGKSLLVYDDVDAQEEIYRKIQMITPSDIMETAQEIFTNMSCLIYK